MAEEGGGDALYVADQFRRYYRANAERVMAPSEMRAREFGFLSFGGRTMARHLAFDDPRQIWRYLEENAPAHVYYSSAYYRDPGAEMDRKGWLGADLVFDIDADHIETPCKADHDRWRCRRCGAEGGGTSPEACRGCGGGAFDEETWICDMCLEAAKYEAQKLLDILVQDFGFAPSRDIWLNFTGNRGYHVHVVDPRVRGLDQPSRREVVDYIMGTGLRPEYHGFARGLGGPSSLADWGWRGRSARAIYDHLTRADPGSIWGPGGVSPTGASPAEARDTVLRVLREGHPGGIRRLIDPKALGVLMEAAVKEQASAIDTVVTTDIHRLIRLPNTLNGKTGFLAQAVDIGELEAYDPLISAIAFKEGTGTLHVRRAPRFMLGGEVYGPFDDERVELPLEAAILLLCRRAARVER